MKDKYMRQIVPAGYAVPQKEILRLTEELRQARAVELAQASEKDRARIEKEISREVRRRSTRPHGLGGAILHFLGQERVRK
jgi:hypothetical protein